MHVFDPSIGEIYVLYDIENEKKQKECKAIGEKMLYKTTEIKITDRDSYREACMRIYKSGIPSTVIYYLSEDKIYFGMSGEYDELIHKVYIYSNIIYSNADNIEEGFKLVGTYLPEQKLSEKYNATLYSKLKPLLKSDDYVY